MARILVVEDESIVALDIRKTLMDMGHDVPSAVTSGEECIKRASEYCPDLVMMDIHIRGVYDGITTATLLRERFDVPIVYLTAHADDETISRAKVTAPFGYILKPFKPVELKSVVEIALSKHEMERRVRQREKWLSTSLQAVGDAVIAVDKFGEITFLNSAAESITGYSLKDVLGKKLLDVMPLINERTRELVQTPIIRILKEKKIFSLPEYTSMLAHDAEVPIENSAAITDSVGDLSGAVIVFRRDESNQERLSQQVALADRLTSLGTLVSGVAHEINNPLSVIVANATFVVEELEKRTSTQKDLREVLESMQDVQYAAERVRRIVSDLKFFSQPQTENIKPMKVNDVLEWAIRVTSNQIRHCCTLSKSFKADQFIKGSELKLGQVFVNLIVNATQAMETGNPNNQMIISTYDANDDVIIEIQDTGCGIGPETIKRIFDPFFTTKPAGIGTGLGLSISRGIINSLGGTIKVESYVGKGTTFKIRLPSSTESRQSAYLGQNNSIAIRRSKILVVDDEPLLLKLIQRTLFDEHEVVVKESSLEALQYIRSNPDLDMILCDLMMPDMTGAELFDKVCDFQPDLARKFAFMTGGAFTASVNNFLENTTQKCLDKPFTPGSLRLFVKDFLIANPLIV